MPDDFDYSLPRGAKLRPSADQPIITMLLIALSIVFTAAFWYSEYDKSSPVQVIANIGLVTSWDIWDGKYWGLITCIFPHINIFHIAFNMLWTWRLGSAIEKEMNPIAYLLFIVAAAILGAGVQLCFFGQTGIGMSGVGYAMFGLLWAGRGASAAWRSLATRDNMNLFIGWGVLCIVTTYLNIMPVANGAHFGGLVFGLCIGYLCYSPRRKPIFALPLALLCIAAVMAVRWMPWSGSWQWWRGNVDLKRGNVVAAINHYNVSVKILGAEEGLLQNIVIARTRLLADAAQNKDAASADRAEADLEKADQELTLFQTVHGKSTANDNTPPDDSSNGPFKVKRK